MSGILRDAEDDREDDDDDNEDDDNEVREKKKVVISHGNCGRVRVRLRLSEGLMNKISGVKICNEAMTKMNMRK